MSNPDNPLFRYIPEQFGPWLVTQVSSGKYPGLEWLDDKKTIFKIPWTKINYPMWEEHHKIFEAWAVHRGKVATETGQLERSFSQIKSNFRTILKKCVEIEEVEDAHQLGLQMGNYKVYRILSNEESTAKRKSQQKTRKAYKLLKQMESDQQILEKDKEFLELIKTKRKRKSKSKPLFDPPPNKQESCDDYSDSLKNAATRTISTQTCISDTADLAYLLEPAAFEEAAVSDAETLPNSCLSALHNSVSTQVEIDSKLSKDDALHPKKRLDMEASLKESPKTLTNFQLLLEAACLAEGESPRPMESPIKKPVLSSRRVSPSIVDVLLELKISPSELFTYEMSVRYEARQVVNEMSLNDMSYGYRICYGSNDHRVAPKPDRPEKRDFFDEQVCTAVSLPESAVPPGNDLYAVLRHIDNGLLVKSDQRHTLKAKRLCRSRVYAFTSYGECEADLEPMLLQRNQEVVLFSYHNFLKDWHRFLIEGSPKPNHEINLAVGKKTKQRHSRAFVSISLVPKAAETMLRRIAENIEEATLDSVLKLFNGDLM